MSSNLGGVGSRVLAVHVKEGVAGAPLQPGQLHDVRAQPVRRLLVKNTERMLFYGEILQFFLLIFSNEIFTIVHLLLCRGGGIKLLKVRVACRSSHWLPENKQFHLFPLKSFLFGKPFENG